mmetsp:Transcript_31021/g.98513  ORF Transcript_31021/g.98513 Transcript_31021/m.98513 type:complete len:213 (+) Transcript_31021:1887-2525(+)
MPCAPPAVSVALVSVILDNVVVEPRDAWEMDDIDRWRYRSLSRRRSTLSLFLGAALRAATGGGDAPTVLAPTVFAPTVLRLVSASEKLPLCVFGRFFGEVATALSRSASGFPIISMPMRIAASSTLFGCRIPSSVFCTQCCSPDTLFTRCKLGTPPCVDPSQQTFQREISASSGPMNKPNRRADDVAEVSGSRGVATPHASPNFMASASSRS